MLTLSLFNIKCFWHHRISLLACKDELDARKSLDKVAHGVVDSDRKATRARPEAEKVVTTYVNYRRHVHNHTVDEQVVAKSDSFLVNFKSNVVAKGLWASGLGYSCIRKTRRTW